MIKKSILKKINDLKNKNFKTGTDKIRIYLAGPMENKEDFGTGWRNEIEPRLKEAGFDTFNPANEVKLFKEIKEQKENMENGFSISGMKKQFQGIIFEDLDQILKSDVVLCNWETKYSSSGTSGELTVARLFNVPVLMITQDDLEVIPKWIFGCITLIKENFDTVERDIRYLFNGGASLWQEEK